MAKTKATAQRAAPRSGARRNLSPGVSDVRLRERCDPGSRHFHLDDYPYYLMAGALERYSSAIEAALKEFGLDRPSWRALMVLSEKDPSGATEIAEKTVTKLSTMIRVLQRMELDGLVFREPRPTDSRITDVHMTERGKLVLARLKKIASNIFARSFDGIPDSDFDAFIGVLKSANTNMSRSPFE
jgi:MarR family transcriptional regulator, organic hydroperoxide resistance regulator